MVAGSTLNSFARTARIRSVISFLFMDYEDDFGLKCLSIPRFDSSDQAPAAFSLWPSSILLFCGRGQEMFHQNCLCKRITLDPGARFGLGWRMIDSGVPNT